MLDSVVSLENVVYGTKVECFKLLHEKLFCSVFIVPMLENGEEFE